MPLEIIRRDNDSVEVEGGRRSARGECRRPAAGGSGPKGRDEVRAGPRS
jgi:hypothetical protein